MEKDTTKEEKLSELKTLLQTYGGELDIDPYILQYLSLEELDNIINKILKKRETMITDNHEWLQKFKTK